LNYEERQEMKKRILILASRSEFPITPNQISEKFEISYSTAIALCFELLNEGFLKMQENSFHRNFILTTEYREKLEVKEMP
jgi:predicted transcriptional regulator